MNAGRPAVGLFAKPVVSGEVKTRLCPPLSPDGAAALYGAFLSDLTAMLTGEPAWDTVVYSTDPRAQERTWPEGAMRPPRLREQRGRDLGERMHAALDELLAEGRPAAILMGSDHPTLPASRIHRAFDLLAGRDAVFGPTLDGGYYLVGVSRPHPRLFEGMQWSVPDVLARTLDRVREARFDVAFLDPWYDVDVEEDLRFLRLHLDAMAVEAHGSAPPCPHTRRVLAETLPPRPPTRP
jgi:hypothetical protein